MNALPLAKTSSPKLASAVGLAAGICSDRVSKARLLIGHLPKIQASNAGRDGGVNAVGSSGFIL